MTRSLTLCFLLSAAVAATDDVEPRCNRQGGTILVWHDYDDCNFTGDPNEIDPWNFNGTVATPDQSSPPLYSGSWRVGATADFNHDGVCDLGWTFSGSNDLQVAVALSVDGDFQTPSGGGTQLMGPWNLVGAADYVGMDGPGGRPTAADGRADLLFWNRDTGQLGVWATDSAGGTPGVLHLAAGRDLAWQPSVIANLDGNDVSTTSEIVWRQEPTGHLSYTRLEWRAGALLHVDGEMLNPIAPLAGGWWIRASDDFNGDKHDDLVFQHEGSQKVVVWLMNGPQRIGGTFMQPDRLIPPCVAQMAALPRYEVVGPR